MFAFGVMGKRILLIVFGVMLVITLLFGAVTLRTFQEASFMSAQSQLETMLLQIQAKLNQEYQTLLQLSEQMMPHGPVGAHLQDFLRAEDSFDRGEAKRSLSKAFITNGGLWTQLMMYFDPGTGQSVFTNFPFRAGFYPQVLERSVFSNLFVNYQAIHLSHYRHSSQTVLSITREAEFSGDHRYVIYLELISSVPAMLREVDDSLPDAFALVQLNQQGQVIYTSRPDWVKEGTLMAGEAGFGLFQGHYAARASLLFGSQVMILSPQAAFNRVTAQWVNRAVLLGVLAVFTVLLATFLLYRHVFRGLRVFRAEIDRSLAGDLDPVVDRTGIRELDQLLVRFDRMKKSIRQSMEDLSENEKKQSFRERELLMYQINPHFLLNSLNSLHWLALINDRPQISGYANALSQILSYNLGRTVRHPVLRDEINILRLYIGLEQTRHDFTVNYEVEEGALLDIPTPRLILQPVVENAIGHGLDEHGQLTIRVRDNQEDGCVHIDIIDNGMGIPEEKLDEINRDEGKGVGLRYVKTALQSLYGEEARFLVENGERGGTRVRLVLPYQ